MLQKRLLCAIEFGTRRHFIKQTNLLLNVSFEKQNIVTSICEQYIVLFPATRTTSYLHITKIKVAKIGACPERGPMCQSHEPKRRRQNKMSSNFKQDKIEKGWKGVIHLSFWFIKNRIFICAPKVDTC